jgi:hypothetical protein
MVLQPNFNQSVLMQHVATALVEAVESLVNHGMIAPGAGSQLLTAAIKGLPAGVQAMISFETHRLWRNALHDFELRTSAGEPLISA